MSGGLAHAHDVVDAHPAELRLRQQGARGGLLGVAEHEVDLVHGREAGRVDLGRAAGDDDAGVRVFAASLADGLAGLANGLAGHRAGVEDDGVADAVGLGPGADLLGLIGVEPAAEGDDAGAALRFRDSGRIHDLFGQNRVPRANPATKPDSPLGSSMARMRSLYFASQSAFSCCWAAI